MNYTTNTTDPSEFWQRMFGQQVYESVLQQAAARTWGQREAVTRQRLEEMELRRAGNLMLEACERGWKVRLLDYGGAGMCAEFMSPAGKLWNGRLERSAREAMLAALDRLEKELNQERHG